MARHGVDYETIKQTAIKLLGRGIAPSVQKIREILGTGSHTTIAAHLTKWRDEYAKAKVHYLPAHMPKELISAFEILWQTAMEHASTQLATYKETLEKERQAVLEIQKETEKNSKALKQNYDDLVLKLEQQTATNQDLKTELAIVTERLEKQNDAFTQEKVQYETRLQRCYQERDDIIHENKKYQAKLNNLHEKLNLQIEDSQKWVEQQRALQEQSENRWLALIDQAKQETKNSNKQFDNYRNKSNQALKQVTEKLADIQQSQFEKDLELKSKQKKINQLEKEKLELEDVNTNLQARIFEVDKKIKTVTNRGKNNKRKKA